MENNTKIAIGLFGLAGIGGAVYAFKDKLFNPTSSNIGYEQEGGSQSQTTPNYNSGVSNFTQSNTLTNNSSSSYSSGSFPLQKKLGYNPLAEELQEILNYKFNAGLTVDGFFGGGTENALKKYTGKISLTETEFNELKNGSSLINSNTTAVGTVASDNQTNISLAAQIHEDINEIWGFRDNDLYKRVNALNDSSLTSLANIYKNSYNISLYKDIGYETSATKTMYAITTRLSNLGLK